MVEINFFPNFFLKKQRGEYFAPLLSLQGFGEDTWKYLNDASLDRKNVC